MFTRGYPESIDSMIFKVIIRNHQNLIVILVQSFIHPLKTSRSPKILMIIWYHLISSDIPMKFHSLETHIKPIHTYLYIWGSAWHPHGISPSYATSTSIHSRGTNFGDVRRISTASGEQRCQRWSQVVQRCSPGFFRWFSALIKMLSWHDIWKMWW